METPNISDVINLVRGLFNSNMSLGQIKSIEKKNYKKAELQITFFNYAPDDKEAIGKIHISLSEIDEDTMEKNLRLKRFPNFYLKIDGYLFCLFFKTNQYSNRGEFFIVEGEEVPTID